MVNRAVDLADKCTKFSEHFSPKVIARLNDYEVKLVRIRGEFVWHTTTKPVAGGISESRE